MEVWAEDQLTRRERLRTARELEHAAPARIRLKFAAVAVIAIGLLTWLTVSWLSGTTPAGTELPGPPPLQGAGPEASSPAGASDTEAASAEPPRPAAAPTSSVVPSAGAGAQAAAESKVVVHVGGAVSDPGVVELMAGARVHEAIEAAGGMTRKADPGGLNLAAPVQDGTLIWVPTPEELTTGAGPPGAGAPGADAGAPPVSVPGPGVGVSPGSDAGLINLNTADAATLDELPGIGPALSERIIRHREVNGPFASLEELAGVSGIGPVILGDVEGLVTW